MSWRYEAEPSTKSLATKERAHAFQPHRLSNPAMVARAPPLEAHASQAFNHSPQLLVCR